MLLFPTITVCTDFSPGALAAVERAVQLAVEHGAALRLLQVCDTSPLSDPAATLPASAVKQPDAQATLDARAAKQRQRLADLASQLAQRTGLTVESVLGIGTAHVVISENVQSQPPSLLVLGSRFDPTASGLGGTALQMLRAPGCPVLLVRRRSAKPYQRVLAGVDLRDGSVRAAVAALALFPGAHHHLLYAVATTLDSSLEAGGLDADQVQSLHEAMYQHAALHVLQFISGDVLVVP